MSYTYEVKLLDVMEVYKELAFHTYHVVSEHEELSTSEAADEAINTMTYSDCVHYWHIKLVLCARVTDFILGDYKYTTDNGYTVYS